MQKHLSDVIKKIDEKQNKKSIWDEIQKLQVEIFRYRKKLYLIPDWFYKLSRRKMQSIEDTFAETVSEDYRSPKF